VSLRDIQPFQEISAKGIVLNLQLSLAVLIASQVVRRPLGWHHFSILIV
jgi:hypothetical protein